MAGMIRVEGLSRHFGSTRALDGVDLEVAGGTVLGLLGPNGAGKPPRCGSWPRCWAPTGGHAAVGGYDVVRPPHQVRQLIGLAGQYAAVDEHLSGTKNLYMLGRAGRPHPGRRRPPGGQPGGDLGRRHAARVPDHHRPPQPPSAGSC